MNEEERFCPECGSKKPEPKKEEEAPVN